MRLVVLYGSQTGTAQDMAEQIWRESKRYGYNGPVLPVDEFPIEQLTEEHLVVFVVATTGNGDEPDNMRKTWKLLLRRSLPSALLLGMRFACLGLGDSSYAKFNWAAKKLHKRLQQLGAKELLPLGLCDDQHDYGLGAVALPWIEQLWQELGQNAAIQNGVADVFKWTVQTLPSLPQPVDTESLCWPYPEAPQRFVLTQNVRTTAPDHFQDVRQLRFQIPDGVTWRPGDILQLQPCNADDSVNQFFELVAEHKLDFAADTVVQLHAVYNDMPLPKYLVQPVPVSMLVKYVWDLSARPRPRAFELLALNCDNELEREKLQEFNTVAGLEDLIAYVNRPRRTILEVLQDFPHATSKLTLPLFAELFGQIQARSFSIASAPETGALDLLVAVVEYRTKLSTPRLGLCSNWLKQLSVGEVVLGAIKPGTMILPKELNTPIVMVGPGTGIAPFRAVVQSRAIAKQQGAHVGPLIVFFGCRGKNRDFHYGEDLTNCQNSKLIELYVAFSRDQEQKIYVQHLIKKNAINLSKLIREENAYIFVAGSSNNMPKAVKEAFVEVLQGDEAYVEHMIKTKRYQEETWS